MNAAKGWCFELWVRYISGLGSGHAFEVFLMDRGDGTESSSGSVVMFG